MPGTVGGKPTGTRIEPGERNVLTCLQSRIVLDIAEPAKRWVATGFAASHRQGKAHREGIEGRRAMKKTKVKAKVTYAPFEVADYLDSEEAIAEYLSLAARDENPGVLLKALGDVAKARGMAEVAKASGLGRESLYKTLAPGAKPRFETIATIMRALNVGFAVESRLPVRAKKVRKLSAA